MEVGVEQKGSGAEHEKPCKICRRRKVKCDKSSPCSNCQRAAVECVYDDGANNQLSHSTVVLKEKIRQLEEEVSSLKQQLVASHKDTISPSSREQQQSNRPRGAIYAVDAVMRSLVADTAADVSDHEATYRGRLLSQAGMSRHLTNAFWASMYDEIDSLNFMLIDTTTSDTQWMFDSHMSHYQPLSRAFSHAQCAFLIDAYTENVDQFVRVLHKSSLRKQLNHVQRGIAEPEIMCQLSAVYSLAVLSLSEEDCLIHLGERRDNLLNGLRVDVEQGLGGLSLTTTHRVSSLQTLLLHVSYLIWTGSHVHASSLLGLAMKISQRLGVHRDGNNFRLSPWQTELRRRLWHYMAFLDVSCMENHGLETAIPTGFSDVRLPQNNDDAAWDVSDSSTVQPITRRGFTDMTYALMQYEAGAAMRIVLEHSVPASGQEQGFVEFHSRLLHETWKKIEHSYLEMLDSTDLRQALTLDIAILTFKRIEITQLRPLIRSSICNLSLRKSLEHKIITLSLDFCDMVQSIRTKYASRRLDWAILRVFSWHALATELSTVLSGDYAVSTSEEAQRSREKIAKVFRDRPSIDYLKGGDGLWVPLEKLREELEMRVRADEEVRVQEALFGGQAGELLGADLVGMEGVWDDDGLWQTF